MNKAAVEISATPLGGKIMLRAYSGRQRAATAFFRNRPLQETILELLAAQPGDDCHVLFHASSVGAEPYSFAIGCMASGLAAKKNIHIHACDLNSDFMQLARQAHYPASIFEDMLPQEKEYFIDAGAGNVTPRDEVKAMVSFLPPASFVDFKSDLSYDAVFITNAFTFVSEEEQSRAIASTRLYNRRYFITTSFYPDIIESDMVQNGYRPVLKRLREIHDAWQERIQTDALPLKGTPEYCWVLSPFHEAPGHEYKYCAIFEKI